MFAAAGDCRDVGVRFPANEGCALPVIRPERRFLQGKLVWPQWSIQGRLWTTNSSSSRRPEGKDEWS